MKKQLEKILHNEIPLSQAIGIAVVEYGASGLSLFAPLENNINHKSTAFGGSLYAVSVLTGWGLIYLLLREHGLSGHIVIQASGTKFLKPVTTDIVTKCTFKSKQQTEKFIKMYKRKGIARIQLEVAVISHEETCVLFEGSYVVHSRY